MSSCRQDMAAPSARTLLAEVTDVSAPAPAPSLDVCDDKCQTQVCSCTAACWVENVQLGLQPMFGPWCKRC